MKTVNDKLGTDSAVRVIGQKHTKEITPHPKNKTKQNCTTLKALIESWTKHTEKSGNLIYGDVRKYNPRLYSGC